MLLKKSMRFIYGNWELLLKLKMSSQAMATP